MNFGMQFFNRTFACTIVFFAVDLRDKFGRPLQCNVHPRERCVLGTPEYLPHRLDCPRLHM